MPEMRYIIHYKRCNLVKLVKLSVRVIINPFACVRLYCDKILDATLYNVVDDHQNDNNGDWFFHFGL